MRYDAGEVITAMVTPFNEKREVDYEKVEQLAYQLINTGSDAVLVTGTTGESPTLTHEEEIEILCSAKRGVGANGKVIMGTGSNSTETAVMMAKKAEKEGVDAILSVVPYYNKPSQSGIIEHFSAVAEAVELPVILYNIPSRTGVNIKPETAAELAKLPRVNGIKEASGDLDQVAKIHELCGDELNIWSGNDDQIFDILERGGKGVISVLSNIAPKETHEIVASYLNGDKKTSKELMDKYVKLAKAMFVDVNPIPVKEAVSLIGFNAGPLRLPLIEMDESNKKYVKETMEEYGLVK